MGTHVFQITKSLHGGGGKYALRLNEALIKEGTSSSVHCLDDSTLKESVRLGGRYANYFDWGLAGVYHRIASAPFHTFLRRREWELSTLPTSCDVIHLHSISGFIGESGLQRLIRGCSRIFWTAHNPWMFTGGCVTYDGCERFSDGCRNCPILKGPLCMLPRYELWRKRRWLEQFAVQPIANSKWMAAMMKRSPIFEGLDTISIVPPIVDEVFEPQRDRAAARSALKISEDRFVVGLSASSLTDPGKGIKEFFEKIPRDAGWLARVTFLLIGDGKVAVPPEIATRFVGRVTEPQVLADLYSCCDCFVSPSFMETFGMAISEAQACGTPVLAFSTGGTPEAVYPDQPCCLVPNLNFTELYSSLESAVFTGPVDVSQRQKLGEWVKGRLGAESIARQQIRIYEDCVDGNLCFQTT